MKISIVLGTRPEIIKMAPVIRACEQTFGKSLIKNSAADMDYFILHTGQHYSYNMDRVFFEQLELPEAQYNLDVGSGSHGEQTGKILNGIEQVLLNEHPDIVLVEGDTNTVLAGALAASKLHISPYRACGGTGRARDRAEPHKSRSCRGRFAEF